MAQDWLDQATHFLSTADGQQIALLAVAAAGAFLLSIALGGFLTVLAWRAGTGSLKLSWLLGRGSGRLLCRSAAWSAGKAFGWMGSRQPQELARTLLDALDGPAKREGESGLSFSGCFVGPPPAPKPTTKETPTGPAVAAPTLSDGYLIQAHGEDAVPLLYKWERKAVIAKAKEVVRLIAACDLADRKALLVRMVRLSGPRGEDFTSLNDTLKRIQAAAPGQSSEDGINEEYKRRHLDGGITRVPLDAGQGLKAVPTGKLTAIIENGRNNHGF